MLVMIAIGVGLCLIIKTTFTTDILIPAVMVFSVFLISVFTDGYVYGILASIVSVIIVNFAFTFPYFKIDFLIPENITSAIIMICHSVYHLWIYKQDKVSGNAQERE